MKYLNGSLLELLKNKKKKRRKGHIIINIIIIIEEHVRNTNARRLKATLIRILLFFPHFAIYIAAMVRITSVVIIIMLIFSKTLKFNDDLIHDK